MITISDYLTLAVKAMKTLILLMLIFPMILNFSLIRCLLKVRRTLGVKRQMQFWGLI